MNETIKEIKALSVFVHDSVFVSEQVIIEVVIVMITALSGFNFSVGEINHLREVLHASIGKHAESFTDGDITEFATSMLEATAVVLKAKYMQKKLPFEKY